MFIKFPPGISVPIFYGYVTLAFLYRFFFGSLFGILISCYALYVFSESLFGAKPFNFDELIMWISDQEETTKAALMSSMVTVLGFLIAFAAATATWKSQLLANIKVQAANEMEVFFAECSKLAGECSIYATALVDAVDKIQKNCSIQEAAFLSHYNRDQGQGFIHNRERLVALGMEVHRLKGKYYNILLSAPGLLAGLDSAISVLHNIIEKLWITVPFHIQGDENTVQTFVNQVNVVDCIALKETVDANFLELNFSSGHVRGNLLSTVVGFNFWTLFYLYKERKNLTSFIKERFKWLIRNG